MKLVTLVISTVAALAFSAGLASAQMQPIPNPPERPHHHHGMVGNHGRHHHAPPRRRHHHHHPRTGH